jgi:hypothetical protein
VTTTDAASDAQRERAERLYQLLRDAVRELPIGQQDAVLEKLSHVLLAASDAENVAPARDFVSGLLLTGQLHRNPHYLKALAAADADLDHELEEAVSVHDFVAERRARQG